MRRESRSDGNDTDVAVVGGENLELDRVVSDDHAATEADRSRNDQRIDSRLAAPAGSRKQVPGYPGDAQPSGDNAQVLATEFLVDRLVGAGATVELHEDCRRDTHEMATPRG